MPDTGSSRQEQKQKLTVAGLRGAKERDHRLTVVTAYDYPSAVLVDQSPIEIILVGDSLGNNVLGYSGTSPVTMDEMLHHLRAVTRAAPHTFIVGDMPFGSYQISPEQAIANAVQFIKAGADCVKLEGGAAFARTVRALVQAGIPVMGHIGLMPQTVHPSAWRVQGRDAATARQIIYDAKALEEAGACSMVLEAVPTPLAAHITATQSVPTIGIGAGPYCTGHVLIWHDMFGLHEYSPRHNKQYANLGEAIAEGLRHYYTDVTDGTFPTSENGYSMKAEELAAAIRGMDEEAKRAD